MPHDPHAQFDHNVLEMIEHSPVGAVPHTPAYQDALGRLRAAHQVYPSADFKGGYVTVRSLAALPAFHAENLEALIAGKIEAAALESDASIFNRYLHALPEALQPRAEAFRAHVVGRRAHHRAKHGGEIARDPLHTLFLIPGTGPHPGLPGNYLYGSLLETPADATGNTWALHVHDSDDGLALCALAAQTDAFEKLHELIASAPFQLSELPELGFRLN
jgi:hypothetical protein